MAPLHFFSQDNQNEVQCNSFGHVTQLMLMLVLHYTESVVNGTIPLVRSR